MKLDYWPVTTTQDAVSSSWTTQLIGGDLRWTGNQHWGVHLKYDTGSESSWTDFWAGMTSGTDTIWSGDLFYAWQLPTLTLRGFVGYGSIQYQHTGPFAGLPSTFTDTSHGWRVGADAVFAIPTSRFTFNASAAFYPSNTTTLTWSAPGGTPSGASSGTASDFSLSFEYTWPSGLVAEAGYRWVTVNTGSRSGSNGCCAFSFAADTFNSSGPFFAVGYHW